MKIEVVFEVFRGAALDFKICTLRRIDLIMEK
jgi:hypothetical protein